MHRLLLALLLLPTLHADGAPDKYAVGKQLYFKHGCNNCHGPRAEGTGNYPLLANRPRGFLAYKLETFRAGVAETAMQEMMIGFARPLSDADIDALSTFLSDFHDDSTERYDPAYQSWGDGGS